MTWSKTPPREPGYYWWRIVPGGRPHLVYLGGAPRDLENHAKRWATYGDWWPEPVLPPDDGWTTVEPAKAKPVQREAVIYPSAPMIDHMFQREEWVQNLRIALSRDIEAAVQKALMDANDKLMGMGPKGRK